MKVLVHHDSFYAIESAKKDLGVNIKKFISPAIVGLMLAASSTALHAYQVTAMQRKACTPDAYRLCNTEIPNVEKVIICLNNNRAKLSPACEAVFAAAQAAYNTRSIAESIAEWCAFTRGDSDPGEQTWKTWCGPAAR